MTPGTPVCSREEFDLGANPEWGAFFNSFSTTFKDEMQNEHTKYFWIGDDGHLWMDGHDLGAYSHTDNQEYVQYIHYTGSVQNLRLSFKIFCETFDPLSNKLLAVKIISTKVLKPLYRWLHGLHML